MRAILNYEIVVQIDRRHKDAIFNLELSNTHLRDRIDPDRTILVASLLCDLCHLLPSGTWGWITLFFAWSSLGFYCCYIQQNPRSSKTGLYGMSLQQPHHPALSWGLHHLCSALSGRKEQYAIIMQPSPILKKVNAKAAPTSCACIADSNCIRTATTAGRWYPCPTATIAGWRADGSSHREHLVHCPAIAGGRQAPFALRIQDAPQTCQLRTVQGQLKSHPTANNTVTTYCRPWFDSY